MRLDQITFLRFVAALGIVMFHGGRTLPSLAWGMSLWSIANTAVSFFFFLSGFILTFVYSERGIDDRRSFYVARAGRIVPLYLLALFVAIVYVALRKEPLLLDEILLSTVLLQSWVPGYSQVLNTPGWSLSVEVFFYLCFPFILPPLLRIRSTTKLAVLFVALWAANLALHISLIEAVGARNAGHTAFADFASFHPLTHVATFVEGGIGALVFMRHRDVFARYAAVLFWGSIGLFALLVFTENPIVQKYHHNGLLAPLFFATISGLAAGERMWVARLFAWWPLILLGEISYGFYILQGPTAAFYFPLWRIAGFESRDARHLSFVIVLCIVSYIAYRFVETPARRYVRAKFG